MKIDPHLRDLYAGDGRSKPRLSREVVTPLLMAAGVIGLPLAFGLSQCSSGSNGWSGATPTVNADTVYPNNHFLAGAGYYHAAYHRWFPLPFNSYEAGRGWYRGGVWRPTAEEDEEERRAEAQSNGGVHRTSTGGFVRTLSSRPTPEAVQSANTAAAAHAGPVMRGGFGRSSRPSIS